MKFLPAIRRMKTLRFDREAGQELFNIMEACSFQDITDSALIKRSARRFAIFRPDRLMIGIWDKEALIDLPVK